MPRKLRKFWLSLALLPLLLTGCVTAPSEMVLTRCPSLRTYTPEFQRKAADELSHLPQGSPVARLVTDYGQLRDACRALSRKTN